MKNLYAIKDTKLGSFLKLIESDNLPVMTRDLQQVVMDENSMLSKYPEDYALYQLGTYMETEGKVIGMEPKFCLNISDIKNIALSEKTYNKAKEKKDV